MSKVKSIIETGKNLKLILLALLLLSLVGDDVSPTYPIPDTTIYDSISTPYILYVKDAPGLCQYWFYDTDGTIQPLLKHQLSNIQFSSYSIYEKQYRLLR